MPALAWLALCLVLGWRILERCDGCAQRLRGERLLHRLVSALLLGLVLSSTLLYLYAWLWARLAGPASHPLLTANLILLACPLLPALALQLRVLLRRTASPEPRPLRLRPRALIPGILAAAFILSAAWFLTAFSLVERGGRLAAGYSIFSDHGPHSALISSLVRGWNIPADYPHFAGAGLRWHALFYVLAANLHYFGLSLATALNLPSAFGIAACLYLLGRLAMRWSGRRAAWFLAPALFLLRSSFAFFTDWLGPALADPGGPLQALATTARFIGRLPRDDWGLWALNVYANQRHFLFALALALLILERVWPLVSSAPRTLRGQWLGRRAWCPSRRAWRRLLPALLLLLVLPWWHGSVLIGLLLMLFVLALGARAKLAFVLAALLAIAGALLGQGLFTGVWRPEPYYLEQAAQQPASLTETIGWHWGFIAPERSLAGVARYLLELSGLVFPLLLLLLVFYRGPRRLAVAALLLPTAFALTISLTPDVTVNHKYIMMTTGLAAIPLSDLLLRLWHGARAQRPVPHEGARIAAGLAAVAGRLLAVLLAALLMATGVVDAAGYRGINRHRFEIQAQGALIDWLLAETRPREILLTPPWHYHSFYLSGRLSYFGHSYYAWSAGYDVGRRQTELESVWAGRWPDGESARQWFRARGLRYVIIDDTLRRETAYALDEAWFEANAERVAGFPEQHNAVVYRVYDD